VQDGASSSQNANSGKPPEYQRAQKIALRLIARAEQCTSGLKRKLEKRGCEETAVNEVIAGLSEKNLVNDSRYARLWIDSRLRFARSPHRLLVSLCAKGIEKDEAETALKEAIDEETEWKMLERFVKKYSKKAGRTKEEISIKLKLKNEGFSRQAVARFLGEE
jgi:regulatory protein